MTEVSGQSRGYRCIVPGCMRRVAYGFVPRLFCEPCWTVIDSQISGALVAAFRDVRQKRPGSLQRYADAKRACHDAAAAAGVLTTLTDHPHAGDEAAVLSSVDQLPGEPPAAASSPPDDDTAVLADPAVSSPVGADGAVLEGPGESTGASTQGEPANTAAGPSAPTTQHTETPAPAETADSASPIAGEQDGEGGAPELGGHGASPEPPQESEAST